MAADHKDRLTAVDASFLAQEKENAHMHVGAVLVFEGPPPSYEEFLEQIESRMHLVPRYRQKLAFPRLEMGRAMWIDDPQWRGFATMDTHRARAAGLVTRSLRDTLRDTLAWEETREEPIIAGSAGRSGAVRACTAASAGVAPWIMACRIISRRATSSGEYRRGRPGT